MEFHENTHSEPDEALDRKIYSSIKERVQAVIFDAVIVFFIAYFSFSGMDSLGMENSSLKAPLFILLFFLYDPLLVAFAGGTIGHKMFDLEVKDATDSERRINIIAALFRFAVKTLLGWISLLTITGNEEKRAIHDFVGGSVVLKKQK